MSLLVTRPEPGASRTVEALRRRGVDVLSAPLFAIVPTGTPRPAGRFAALLITSPNGAAGLSPAAADLPPELPVFAVGDRTADAVSAAGFTSVTSASGDQRALTRLVMGLVQPRYRILLAVGEDHKDALPAALSRAGYEIATWLRYRAKAVPALPEAARVGVADGSVAAVLHFSRRASETFLALGEAAGLREGIAGLGHLCLSEDVAEPLRAAGCSDIRVAAHPDEDSLLALAAPTPARDTPLRDEPLPAVEGPGHGAAQPNEADTAMAASTEGDGGAPAKAARSRRGGSQAIPAPASGAPVEAAAAPVSETGPGTRADVTQGTDAEAVAKAGMKAEVEAKAFAEAKAEAEAGPRREMAEHAAAPPAADGSPGPAAGASSPQPMPAAGAPRAAVPRSGGAASSSPGRGIGSLLGAGLIGGIIGAVALIFTAPVLNSVGIRLPNSPTLAEIAARLTRLEAQRIAAPASPAAVPDPALKAAVDAATSQAAALAQRLDAAERRLGEVAARPSAPASPAAPATAASLPPAALADIDQRIARAQAAAEGAAGAAQGAVSRIAEVERLARSASGPSAAASAAARLLLTERIGRALSSSQPFAGDLAALASLGVPRERLAPLAALADGSAPPLAGLRGEIRGLRDIATAPSGVDPGWGGRLLGLFDGLVRVRSTGAGETASPAGLVARLDEALRREDAAAALAAWGSLPEPPRRASEGWMAPVRARAEAQAGLRALADDAVKALSGAN